VIYGIDWLKVLQNMAGVRHEIHGFTAGYGVSNDAVRFIRPLRAFRGVFE
jgi:hypothetical protein